MDEFLERIMKQKRELQWQSCINVDKIPCTIAFVKYINDKAYETLSTEMYCKVYSLCNIISKGYAQLNKADAEYLNELFPDCNAKEGAKTSKVVHRILRDLGLNTDEYHRLLASYIDEISPMKIIPSTDLFQFTKEMTVVITGGNLRDGEYMVRKMTPEQIYETLRDGFTVTASGFQS